MTEIARGPAPSLDDLRRLSLFASCSDDALERVVRLLEPVELAAGDVVFDAGEPGEEMYIIASGQVRIVSDAAAEKVVFAQLGPGDFFGEMALLTGGERSAAAIASTDALLWRLRKAAFDTVQQELPEIAREMARILGERVQRGNIQRFENEAFTFVTLTPERPEITIGRLPENDVVIHDPQVAGVHARLRNVDGTWTIEDQGSETGTYVNKRRIQRAELADGDEILIGTNKVFLDGLQVKGFAGRDGVRIDARDVTKTLANGQRVLDGVSLSIYPGEFVAVVGASGAGKTTLLHALNGFSPATSGSVTYDGTSLYGNPALFRSSLGYVPQDDIVHGELTVERTLYYGAKLRLPRDTRPEEAARRIDEVLDAVGLQQHRATEVRRLSGGQRKRVSVALELLARPRALFLDEPTSGLDPALEGRMMSLFRELSERGTTVLLSTHATQNLRLCDKVIWMAPGGRLLFYGSPAEALRHFGVSSFEEVYDVTQSEEDQQRWIDSFPGSPAHTVNVVERLGGAQVEDEPETRPAPERHGVLRQFFWLSVRYAEVLRRDWANLALLLVQAPAIGVAALLLFQADIFALTADGGGDAVRALMSMHILTASAIFLGASNAAREITKEAAVYARERLVNVDALPYVLSKAVVLGLLCVVQAVVLVAVFAAGIDLPGSPWQSYGELTAAILLTELAGLSMGLLVSAVSANSDRAMAVVPVLLIPQLIFAGALVPVEGMPLPSKLLSQVMMSKWALELTGIMTGLSERFLGQFPAVFAEPYASGFDGSAWLPWTVLAAFAVALLAATVAVQSRKGIH